MLKKCSDHIEQIFYLLGQIVHCNKKRLNYGKKYLIGKALKEKYLKKWKKEDLFKNMAL